MDGFFLLPASDFRNDFNVLVLKGLGCGGCRYVAGRHRAFEYLFTGDDFNADVAADLGIVNYVLPDGKAIDKAMELARKLSEKSPIVMKLGRDSYMRAIDENFRRDVENVAKTMCNVVATDAAAEGLAAFMEKRLPKWREPC